MLPTPGVGFWSRGRRDEKGPTFLSVRLDLGDLRAELRTCRGRGCRVDGRNLLLELGAENDKKVAVSVWLISSYPLTLAHSRWRAGRGRLLSLAGSVVHYVL